MNQVSSPSAGRQALSLASFEQKDGKIITMPTACRHRRVVYDLKVDQATPCVNP
jgi:hypothetical protein